MRVLLVEPDDRARGRIAAALERRRCTVVTARDDADALALLRRGEPLAAVCVAEALPACWGPDLLAIVDRDASVPPLPTVLCVSDEQSVVARALVRAGCSVVDRDAAPEHVADVVVSAIARWRWPPPAPARKALDRV